MPNIINLASVCVPLLDEVYRIAATTTVLETSSEIVRASANAGEFLVPKYDLDGLGEYDRSKGYAEGSVSLEWEAKKCNYDRGRVFDVDAMDDEESLAQGFGLLSSSFMRQKVAPELDAIRFAQYAANAAAEHIKSEKLGAIVDDVTKAISNGVSALDEAEVPAEERYLFISPTLHNAISSMESYRSKEMLEGFSGIIKVPQRRFFTAVDTLDGRTEAELQGGYKKSETGKNINFMIIHKPAVLQFTKHVVSKIITPEQNQKSDAWRFFYRTYGITDTWDNKATGIYCSHADI